MMKSGLWVMMVVLAGVGGYLLGDSGGGEGRDERRAAEGGRSGGGGVSTRAGERERSRGERSLRGGRRGSEDAEAYLARMLGAEMDLSDDPFGRGGLSDLDYARITAAIFQLPEESFPAVLEYCWGEQDPHDPFADPDMGWDSSLLSKMLARWTDMNPDGAMAWISLEKKGSKYGRLDYFKTLVAREALRTDPDLAIGFIERYLVESNGPEVLANPESAPVPDPFADLLDSVVDLDEFEGAEGNEFFELLCREHPGMALEKFIGASRALKFDGSDGWGTGMVENGMFDEAMEAAVGLDGELGENLREILLNSVSMSDPERLENWLADKSGEDVSYLDDSVMNAKMDQNREEAVEWYLGRSLGPEDRAGRIADLATLVGSWDEQEHWVRKMEAAGEDVGEAWTRVVRGMGAEGGYRLLEKVPGEKREEVLKGLFKSGVKMDGVRVGNSFEDLYAAKPEDLILVERYGFREDYERFIRDHNAEVTGKALEYLAERGLVEMEE